MDQGPSVLVTGGTGLLGAHLLHRLAAQGQRVRATRRAEADISFVEWVFGLYSSNPKPLLDLVEWAEADLLDYPTLLAATQGISTVYHTAAMVSFNPADAQAVLATNVLGTANLVDACLAQGVAELCHVSSVAALGSPNADGLIDERCAWGKSKGRSPYARSKFLGENQAWRAMEMGLRVVVLNPSVILGPGRWTSGSGQLFNRVRRGMPFYTNGVSGYVDVRDVAQAATELMAQPEINGERFVLNSQNISFGELFGLMAHHLHRRAPWLRIPKVLAAAAYPIVWLAGTISGRGNSLSWANLQSAFGQSHYSATKIAAQLNFRFIPIGDSIAFIAKQMG